MSLDKILLSEKIISKGYFMFPLMCYLRSNIIIEMDNKPMVTGVRNWGKEMGRCIKE